MSSRFLVIKAHHFKMHNIKEGHDMKASVGDTFVNYDEDFKKTKTAGKKKLFSQLQNVGKKNLPDPIIFACLFILMGNVLCIFNY
jgi:predicted secreted acid phosphatase